MRKNTLVSARAVLSLVKPRQNFTSFRSYATESSKNRPSVAIFGGNGSLGQHIINHIGQYADVTVGCRHPEQFNKQKHNVVATKCDIRDPNDVEQFVQGKDTIINCVGLLAESDNTFVDIYVEGTKNIAYAARRNGVKNYVQVSAMGAQIDHDSFIADFKYRAEDMAYAAFPDVVIVRPSIMFSDQKNTSALLNKIASTLRFLPVLPLPYNQTVKPVFMDDVARGIAKLSGVVPNSIDARGKTALLEGPNEYTISKAIGLVAGRKIITFPMNQTILSLLTHVNHFVPNPTVTMDLLKMAEGAQLTAEQTKAEIYDPRELRSILEFSDIGVQPQSLESVLGKK